MKKLCAVIALTVVTGVVRADRIDDLEQKVESLLTRQAQLEAELAVVKSGGSSLAVASTPSTQPSVATGKVNRQGPWSVLVVASIVPDVATLQNQLSDEQSKLPALQKKLDQQSKRHDEMAAETVHTGTNYNNNQVVYNTRQKYSPSELGAVGAEVARAKDELSRQKQKVAKLQRDLDSANNSWTVTGTLEDGTGVDVIGQGNVARTLVMQMKAGQRYKIEGNSTIPGGKLTLGVRTVTPMP